MRLMVGMSQRPRMAKQQPTGAPERQQTDAPEIQAALKLLRRSRWFAIVAVDKEQVIQLQDGSDFPATSRMIYHDDETDLDTLEAFLKLSTGLLGIMVHQCEEHRKKLTTDPENLKPTPWA